MIFRQREILLPFLQAVVEDWEDPGIGFIGVIKRVPAEHCVFAGEGVIDAPLQVVLVCAFGTFIGKLIIRQIRVGPKREDRHDRSRYLLSLSYFQIGVAGVVNRLDAGNNGSMALRGDRWGDANIGRIVQHLPESLIGCEEECSILDDRSAHSSAKLVSLEWCDTPASPWDRRGERNTARRSSCGHRETLLRRYSKTSP